MTALTTQLTPYGDEELTSFLVRTAHANGITPRHLNRLIRDTTHTPLRNSRSSLAGTELPSALLEAIGELTGLTSVDQVHAATMQRYRSAATPARVYLPWQPLLGTAICPRCVAEPGAYWRLRWRLPTSFTCAVHRMYLHDRCPRCRKRFHTNRSPALPPDLIQCDNHISGHGTTAIRCGQPLAGLTHRGASAMHLDCDARIQQACDGAPVAEFGGTTAGLIYLVDLYSICLLLSHVAVATNSSRRYSWTDHYAAHASRCRATLAHVGLPDPVTRAHLLSSADHILAQPSPAAAATVLYEHLSAVPRQPSGITSWALSQTRPTPNTRDLIQLALAPHRTIGRHLAATAPAVRYRAHSIPQAIPHHIYQLYFGNMFAASESVGRQYVSLCLARRLRPVDTWAAAGNALALPDEHAHRVALSCSAASLVSRTEFFRRLRQTEFLFSPTINYRVIEDQVRTAAADSAWIERWRQQHCPHAHRHTSQANILEYLWRTWAHGAPCTQVWTRSWDRQRRYRYRVWEQRTAGMVTRE